jgi:NAD(P)-dependent dehydrogenase (short-subunit alcohol dehydrogenase family)
VSRWALVTGANRGLGYETARQLATRGLRVILTARDAEHGRRAVEALAGQGLDVRFEQLDVADATSVRRCAERLRRDGVAVDVLVNNAGVYPTQRVLGVSEDTWHNALEVNLLGAWRTCRAFCPGMLERGYGRVVNVSSGDASVADGVPGPGAYAVSKAALNALTRKLAAEVRVDVKVNAVCPGWVRTDMGGSAAPRSPEEGADTIVWLATLPADGPTGGFFRDRRPIPW